MKNKKTRNIIIAIVVLIIVIWLWKKYKDSKPTETTPSKDGGSASSSSGGSASSSNPNCTNATVLKKGMKGCDRISWSQYKINQVHTMLGIPKLVQDADFGAKTEAAFQKLLGKKTGSWNEVLAKANQMLHNATMQGSDYNPNTGWYYADGTPAW